MASYDYQCPECCYKEEQIHSMKETPEFFCPKCNGKHIQMIRVFAPNRAGFIIKGESIAKDWKEERYRVKRSADMGVRQIERWGGSQRLQPNVAGVETDNWSDAAKMAKEAGIDTSTYIPMIEKEKRTGKNGIDEGAWKKAKDIKNSI